MRMQKELPLLYFKRNKYFLEEDIKEDTFKTRNNIPKNVRWLMREKKEMSSKILLSTLWRKNYKTI